MSEALVGHGRGMGPHWFGELVLAMTIMLAVMFVAYVIATGGRL